MATILRSQLDEAARRRSADDVARIVEALRADGVLTVEEDPEPELEPQLDAEGEEMQDEEGNTIMRPPAPASTINAGLEIAIDNMPREDEPKIPEDIVVEVAPGTQNAAAPFPEDAGDTGRSSRRSRKKDEAKEETSA